MSRFPLWRTILFLFLTIVLLDAQSYIGSGSTVPLGGITDAECLKNKLSIVADNRSLCWYYVCQPAQFGEYKLFPRRCALGTHVSPSYKVNTYNPCTQKFPIMQYYDCTRPRNVDAVVCDSILNCKNGGKPKQEDDRCWCDCPSQWQGSPDCSTAKGPTPPPPSPSPCPTDDWCAKGAASLNGANPCLNGGTCVNQCVNFVCSCTVPFTKTRYCEEFNCTTNNTCPTGEACTRGLNGKDEFYVCRSNSCANNLMHWM